MRILMVNKFLYPRGGAETYFLRIGRHFETHGHQVEYFGMYDEKNTVGNTAGQYTQNMDFHSAGLEKVLYPFKIIYSREAYQKISMVIDDFHPDLIHLNNISFQLTPSIIEAAIRKNVAIVQTVHDYQMICPNHLLFDIKTKKPCEKCVYGSKWNCFKGSCIHGSKIRSLIGTVEALLYKAKGTYSLVDRFICPSYFLEKMLLTKPSFKGRTTVIHNYIEIPDVAETVDNDGLMQKEDYVLFFGRLAEEKGLSIFADACKKLPNVRFKIAGTGPMENLCRNIDNAEFVGFKTGRELNELIGKALFSVYPSICYENCPLSILEAQSLGTPVITTAWGGMMELVEDGYTGVLVEDMNSDNLAGAIEGLFRDRAFVRYMSINCVKKSRTMLAVDQYCEKLIEIYSEELKQ